MAEIEKKIGTIIKTYKGSRKSVNGDKYDTVTIFYRDENGEKKTLFYDRPESTYYIIKDKNSDEAAHPPLYIDINKVEKFTTYSDNLYRDIAVNTGALQFYDRVKFSTGPNSYNMRNLFKSPLLYGADIDIQDQYIAKFYREYEPDSNYKLHKCYFDIEADIYNFHGFPEPTEAPCPVCLITLIDDKSTTSHTFVLRNSENRQLIQFEVEVEEFKTYMKNVVKTNDNLDMSFEFYFYDDEIEMIKSFFAKVHEIDPDYCGGWNIEYDLQTLQHRLIRLYDKVKHKEMSSKEMATYDICDSNCITQTTSTGKTTYVTPTAYYSKGQGKIGRRTDLFTVLDKVNWIDQMLTYGVVHISGGKLDSYKLDYVANVELKKEKLPYGPGETIRNQLYKNTKRFIEYNIRDVLLCLEIEEKTKDIDMVQRLADITVTRNDKCFKKSIALTNFVNKYAFEQGLVMGTNKNTSYGSDSDFYDTHYGSKVDFIEIDPAYTELFNKKDKFGAYVSQPTLNDKVGMEIFKGTFSNYLWELVCDMDFSALYPGISRAFNTDSCNLIGKFFCIDKEIKEKIKSKYNAAEMFALSIKDEDGEDSNDETDDDDDDITDITNDSAGETNDLCSVLADSLISRDWNMIGNLFFDLPSTEDLIVKLEKRS